MFLRVSLLAVIATLAACGGGGSSSPGPTNPAAGFDYSQPASAQAPAIAQEIKARDLAPRNVSVVLEDRLNSAYALRIYQHTVNGVQHYGAITVPTFYGKKHPVVVDLDGLDDDNRPLDVARKVSGLGAQVNSAIFVLPAYRGRSLQFGGRSWAAGGDYCDAFDGAADDAMALLNVLQASVPEADLSRVLVRGGSRGGSVALLLGERDARVTTVAAGSAPVDFYRADVAAGYGAFYQCQFLKGRTADQSRKAMIAASALHFPMLKSVTKVYLDHGGNDDTVPILNAIEMNKRLLADGVSVDYVTYASAGHDLGVVPAYRERQGAIFSAFIAP